MEIHWSEIGSLGKLVDYLPAVNPATLHAWLAVRGSVISAPLDRCAVTRCERCTELRVCTVHSDIDTQVFISD
jgi:hypothetical protein